MMRLAVVIAAILLCGCQGKDKKSQEAPTSPYAPWQDLSAYFDLSKVLSADKELNLYFFNSADLCQGKLPFRNERLNDNAYSATVLGLNVLLRSQPIISQRTVRGSVNTGDVISVEGYSEYHNGKYWNKVQVLSGYSAGKTGYICTDYLIAQDQFQILHNYVFDSPFSNVSVRDESKYLNAISAVLLKLDVATKRQQLAVNFIDVKRFGTYEVVTFQLRDLNATSNNTLLAFIQFEYGKNDYRVIGVVPGTFANDMQRLNNGAYEIYLTK